MKIIRSAFRALLMIFMSLTFISLAQAQATRTWVSGVGDDVNPCSRTAPCKTFAGAISKTAKGGEINALDAGGFGSVTITKSITIDGTGPMSSILGSGTNGIVINITDTSDIDKTVRIRGLALNGAGSGLQGIKIVAANKVLIENTIIDGFKEGISVESHIPAQVFVKDTTIRNNSVNGISVVPGGGQTAVSNVVAILSSVTVVFNGTGLAATAGGSIVSFKNNFIYGNKKDGEPTSFILPR